MRRRAGALSHLASSTSPRLPRRQRRTDRRRLWRSDLEHARGLPARQTERSFGSAADGQSGRPPGRAYRRIRSGPCFRPPSHYVIILAISRQCPVVANVQMPLTVNTANAHHHERELLHTRCLCTPTVAYAVPSRKRLRTSVGLSRFPDGARAGFIRYSLAPLNCWSDDSAGNTRPRGRRTARG